MQSKIPNAQRILTRQISTENFSMEKNFTSDEIKLIEHPENDLEISLLRIVKDKVNDTRSDNAKEQKM